MKNFRTLTAAVIIGAVATLTFANTPVANAGDLFSFSFNTGDVAFAYSDGYWDNSHTWHRWHNQHEARMYRERYAENYHASRHTREHNNGWRRDDDHDGVPNNRDRAPENPNRQ